MKIIEFLLAQMNNNRLSTNTNSVLPIDRSQLLTDANSLIDGVSNYEIKSGVKFIISSNKAVRVICRTKIGVAVLEKASDKVLKTFESYHDCASFLGVTHPSISYRIKKQTFFL